MIHFETNKQKNHSDGEKPTDVWLTNWSSYRSCRDLLYKCI